MPACHQCLPACLPSSTAPPAPQLPRRALACSAQVKRPGGGSSVHARAGAGACGGGGREGGGELLLRPRSLSASAPAAHATPVPPSACLARRGSHSAGLELRWLSSRRLHRGRLGRLGSRCLHRGRLGRLSSRRNRSSGRLGRRRNAQGRQGPARQLRRRRRNHRRLGGGRGRALGGGQRLQHGGRREGGERRVKGE